MIRPLLRVENDDSDAQPIRGKRRFVPLEEQLGAPGGEGDRVVGGQHTESPGRT